MPTPKCVYCSMLFEDKATLVAHLATIHGDNPMKCHICSRQCLYPSAHEQHVQTHKNKEGKKRPAESVAGKNVVKRKRPCQPADVPTLTTNVGLPLIFIATPPSFPVQAFNEPTTSKASMVEKSTSPICVTTETTYNLAAPQDEPLDLSIGSSEPVDLRKKVDNSEDWPEWSPPSPGTLSDITSPSYTRAEDLMATYTPETEPVSPLPQHECDDATSLQQELDLVMEGLNIPSPSSVDEVLYTPHISPVQTEINTDINSYAEVLDRLKSSREKIAELLDDYDSIEKWISERLTRNKQTGAGHYTCPKCDRTWKTKKNLKRHINTHSNVKKYACVCGRLFHRKDTMSTHTKICPVNYEKTHADTEPSAVPSDNERVNVPSTSKQSENLENTNNVFTETEPVASTSNAIPPSNQTDTPYQSAINDNLRHYSFNGEKYVDPLAFLNNVKPQILDIVSRRVTDRKGVKWYIVLNTKFIKYDADDNEEPKTPHFRSFAMSAVNVHELDDSYEDAVKAILNSIGNFTRDGSGYTFDEITSLDLDIAQYTPIRPTSYIPLPKQLRDKKCIVNVINNDLECFKWCILAKIHPVRMHRAHIRNYVQYRNELNFDNIAFPVSINSIARFEKLNDISVNVFGYEKNIPFPVYITSQKKEKHVDLLLINRGTDSHYCLITDFSRFLASLTKSGAKRYFCTYCMHGFTRKDLLEAHEPLCRVHGGQRVKMPDDGDSIYYKDFHKQLEVPFVIYADLESITEQIHSATPDPTRSYTNRYQQHTACGFSYVVVSTNEDNFKPPVVYRGVDAIDRFIDELLAEERWIKQKLEHIEPMIFTDTDQIKYDSSVNCHICNDELGNDRVRDHDHITGKFRGAAHNRCNLNYVYSKKIPVVMHNLRGYDSHLILQRLSKIKDKEITCIPNNTERYISFGIGDIQFIDSFQFMSTSLEKLVGNLAAQGVDKFTLLNKCFDKDKLPLLLRKGVYPYDEMSSFDKFNQTTLPTKESFYNVLRGEHISDADYQHAQNVWNTFSMSTMGDYHDLYLLSDCLLLADVFQSFRSLCMEYYKLDPCHFYTAPGLAWQACLKMTGVELELLTDITQYNFVEAGLRGGISVISKRYCEANNPYMENYDVSKENSYIMYLDANNLYGYSMMQPLPTEGFRWLNQHEIDEFDIAQVDNDGGDGYILEVDLKYPSKIHRDHNEYPLAAEKLKVTEDMLSTYSQQLLETLNMKHTPYEKLIPNLNDKSHYIIHHTNLKQCVELGLEITKIHKVLTFKQSRWLKKYIDFNTEKRAMAKNDFEKDFFKLSNNAVFGKTCENLRKRVNIKLVTNEKKLLKLIAMPSFTSFHIFDEDFVAVKLKQTNLHLNRPTYVGFCVLDVSKTLMYEFHYNYMKQKFGDRAQLAFTDTDSLLYHVTTDDIYRDMYEDIDRFDTSDYPPNHFMYSRVNKKKVGKMKDETSSSPISQFCGLRSKMYSFKFVNSQGCVTEKKTAKGITQSVTKRDMRHQDYKDCLRLGRIKMANMKQIRSFKHQLFSISLNKIGLSPYDDKRYILEDGIETLAHGHTDIRK